MGVTRASDTLADRHWDRFALRDPYWAVLTEERFQGASMSQEDRDEFFARGDVHWRAVMATRATMYGGKRPPRRVLDFGCGVGRLLPSLSRSCVEVVGVDVAPAMVEEARANCERLAISNAEVVCDSDQLSGVPGEFDLIHSVLVFQHIAPDRGERILGRLCDKLAVGGLGAVHFTVGTQESRFQRNVAETRALVRPLHWFLNVVSGRPASEPLMRMHVYSRDRLAEVVVGHGCRVLEMQSLEIPKHDSVFLWIHRP